MTKNERYFMRKYDGQYYIFDSRKISPEEVDSESGAMTLEEVLEKLNFSQVAIDDLVDIMFVSSNKLLEIGNIVDDYKEYIDDMVD